MHQMAGLMLMEAHEVDLQGFDLCPGEVRVPENGA
jgi:hypothetical protein